MPHEHAEMEIILDDSQADTESHNGVYREPSTSSWVPEVNETVGEGLEENESALFAKMPQVCSYQSNLERAPEPVTMSPAPAPVKVKRGHPKKVQEGLGLLNV